MAMQDMLLKRGIFNEHKDKSQRKESKGKQHNSPEIVEDGNESETTIYHNILEKVDEVDPEITFNRTKMRDSSSSEEHDVQIDTSDELIEPDVNKKFIADCAAEAERQ